MEQSNGPAAVARSGLSALVAPRLREALSLSSNASKTVIEPKQSDNEVNDGYCIDKTDVTSNPISPSRRSNSG